MRTYEVEGDSPEEIIAHFLAQRNIPKDYIEYEIVDLGSKGLFGIGKKIAKLKISYNDVEHIKRKSRIVLADILEKAGFLDAHIEVKAEGEKITLNIETAEPEALIGKNAQTLDALQYIVDKILRLEEGSPTVTVDVGGYRKRTSGQNIEKAKELAEQAIKTGKTMKLTPMTTIMRKEIHIALKEIDGITTMSIGEGNIKQLCIVPDKKR